jgi:phosphoglycolate phosphatase
MATTTPRAILFDLDGTLLDTAEDLVHACNAAASEAGLAPQPLAALRPLISGGAEAMLAHVRSQDPKPVDGRALLERMLNLYEDNIAVHTRYFEGIEAVLDELEHRGLPWGIVTNKVTRFTHRLLQSLGVFDRPGCIISGDTLAQKKPHPAPMLEASRRLKREASDCVYVGDARRDIQAGRNAGMHTLAALYGYVGDDDPARDWGADGMLGQPSDLLNWLDTRGA